MNIIFYINTVHGKQLKRRVKTVEELLNCRPTCLSEGQRKTVACYEAECPKVTEINSQGNKKVNTRVITGCLEKSI